MFDLIFNLKGFNFIFRTHLPLPYKHLLLLFFPSPVALLIGIGPSISHSKGNLRRYSAASFRNIVHESTLNQFTD